MKNQLEILASAREGWARQFRSLGGWWPQYVAQGRLLKAIAEFSDATGLKNFRLFYRVDPTTCSLVKVRNEFGGLTKRVIEQVDHAGEAPNWAFINAAIEFQNNAVKRLNSTHDAAKRNELHAVMLQQACTKIGGSQILECSAEAESSKVVLNAMHRAVRRVRDGNSWEEALVQYLAVMDKLDCAKAA